MIEILAPGPLATVQDLGRPGYAALGVARSGAFDRASAQLANRLVGNDPGAALIEVTLGGLALRTLDAATIACCGAPCAGVGWNAAVSLAAGSVLRLGAPPSGLRSYLAMRGGLAVGTALGSCSTDTLGGLGPPALRAGDRLVVGLPPDRDPVDAPVAVRPRAEALRWSVGPRADWFTDGSLFALVHKVWTVRAESDRVGVRLAGPPLRRVRHDELPSEPVLPGAVQVPPDGRPIVLGPDAPVTGGYPVLAIVDDLDALAQLRPGDLVRFAELRNA